MFTSIHRTTLSLLGLSWLAFALRTYRLSFQSLWRDEVDALIFATRALPELLATFRKPGENGPLFFLVLRPWLAAAGESEFALRFPSVLAGTLAVPISYALVRRLAGQGPALLTAVLMATAPYLVWYGQEARMYAALTALVPLTLWLTLEAGRHGGWRWVLLYIVTSLCFYTHVLAVLVVPLQALWLLILLPQYRPGASVLRRWVPAVLYFAALVLPYLPLAWWQAKLWLSPTFRTGHPFVPLPDILTVLAVAFSRGILPVAVPATLLPSLLALLAGVGLWASGRGSSGVNLGHWPTVVLLVAWLLLPPLAVYGISLGMPIFADRYLIWAMPAWLGLVAMGVVALTRAWRPLGYATLGAIIALNLTAAWAQVHRPVKADFRSAASFVLAYRQPGDLLIFQIPYNRLVFTYYAGGELNPAGGRPPELVGGLRWMDGPYTNHGLDEDALARQMAEGTAAADAVWFIASEAEMWDARGLTQAWFAAHGAVTHQAEFARVAVTRYDLHNKR
jgi:4-amino-4-deoxy-L-arabinose transferase-like glycosyltransferase